MAQRKKYQVGGAANWRGRLAGPAVPLPVPQLAVPRVPAARLAFKGGGERLLGAGMARRTAEQLKGRRKRLEEEEAKAMAKGGRATKTERLTGAAFREVHRDEPSVVGKTRAKFGEERAKAQQTAIALSKARAAGARIPKAKGYAEGGHVNRSDRMSQEAIMAPYTRSRQPRD